jgi:KUP system potassium uptake protein
VLHQKVIILSIVTEHSPEVPKNKRITLEAMGQEFYRVTARYGYMQSPNIFELLSELGKKGLKVDETELSFFLGRETILTTGKSGLYRFSKKLFVLLSRNATPARAFFGIPTDRVIEIGTQVEI